MRTKSIRLSRHILACSVAACCMMCTGCTSVSGDRIGVLYIVLLWAGACAGFFISDLIWASDDPGSYTPAWEVILWFAFTALGVFLGYVKPYAVWSGALVAAAVPVAGMGLTALVVHQLKKMHRN